MWLKGYDICYCKIKYEIKVVNFKLRFIKVKVIFSLLSIIINKYQPAPNFNKSSHSTQRLILTIKCNCWLQLILENMILPLVNLIFFYFSFFSFNFLILPPMAACDFLPWLPQATFHSCLWQLWWIRKKNNNKGKKNRKEEGEKKEKTLLINYNFTFLII